MSPELDLPVISIASPCKAAWSGMKGDDRARHCSACDKFVYNIAALTPAEVRELVERTEGRFCARLHQRRDGTYLTADCPVGWNEISRHRMRRLLTTAALVGGFVATGAFLRGATLRQFTAPPTGGNATISDWKEWVLVTFGLRPKPVERPFQVTAGVVCIPLPPPVPIAPTEANAAESPGS